MSRYFLLVTFTLWSIFPINLCYKVILGDQYSTDGHIFSRGLSSYMSEDTLAEAFSKFGQVVEARLVIDKVTDRPKGFGFVTFASEDEAQNALKQMNGKVLNGRVIFVDIAKAKPTYAFPIPRGPPNPPSSG